MKKVKLPIAGTLILCLIIITCVSCNKNAKKETTIAPDRNPEAPSNVYKSDMPSNVNLVYFYPKGTSPYPDYQKRLSAIFTFYQKFIADEMKRNGFKRKKFGLMRDTRDRSLVKIIALEGQETSYAKGSGNQGKIRPEVKAYLDRHPDDKNGQLTVIIQRGEDTATGCNFNPTGLRFTGLNGFGYLIDYKLFDMKYYQTDTTEGDCFKLGSNMHELAHAFEVPHDQNHYGQDWLSVMYGGGGRLSKKEWLGRVHFTKAACAIFDVHPDFNTTTRPFYTNPHIETSLKAYVDSQNVIQLNVEVNSPDVAVVNLAVYNDELPAAVNNDYDALSWAVKFTENTAHLEMPLSEFYPKHMTNTAYRMRLKYLLADGSAINKDYFYRFNANGDCDLDIDINTISHLK